MLQVNRNMYWNQNARTKSFVRHNLDSQISKIFEHFTHRAYRLHCLITVNNYAFRTILQSRPDWPYYTEYWYNLPDCLTQFCSRSRVMLCRSTNRNILRTFSSRFAHHTCSRESYKTLTSMATSTENHERSYSVRDYLLLFRGRLCVLLNYWHSFC